MQQLLNKINVLDKGWIALTEAYSVKFNNANSWANMRVRCPLFVQLLFGECGLQTKSISQKAVDAYIPDLNEICSKSNESDRNIRDSMIETTHALLNNPKSYQFEGCDHFIAQINVPISVYNEFEAVGTLDRWALLTRRKHLPSPIEAYRKIIADVLLAEFPKERTYLLNG